MPVIVAPATPQVQIPRHRQILPHHCNLHFKLIDDYKDRFLSVKDLYDGINQGKMSGREYTGSGGLKGSPTSCSGREHVICVDIWFE